MSHDDLRAAVEKKLPSTEQIHAARRAAIARLFGPSNERPNLAKHTGEQA